MFRSELTNRICDIRDLVQEKFVDWGEIAIRLNELNNDIEADGVLDVQAPKEIARDLLLPDGKPVLREHLEVIRDDLYNAHQTGVREILFAAAFEAVNRLTLLSCGIPILAASAAVVRLVRPSESAAVAE